MTPEDQAGLHAAVLANTARNPLWLGYWLARHQQTEDLDEPQLARKLGIAMNNLIALCLCRTPRPDSFQADLDTICQRTGAVPTTLAQLLRQEQGLLQFGQSQPATDAGRLMAASDRPPEPPEAKP